MPSSRLAAFSVLLAALGVAGAAAWPGEARGSEAVAEPALELPAAPAEGGAASTLGAENAVVPTPTPPVEIPPEIAAEFARLRSELEELKRATKTAGPKSSAAKKSGPQDGAKKGRPSVKFGGQVQGDQVMFSQDEVSKQTVGSLQNGAQFRRLRIGARGEAWRQLQYALGVDFALANQPSFLDNYVEANDLPVIGNVRAGHFFEPFSLERVTQNFNNTFMERSSVDTFAPARNMGAMAFGNAENELATWQIGTFRTNSDNTGNDSFDSGQALTMRGTWLPFWDEASDGRAYLHLGAAYSYRDTDQDRVRFRNTPEIRKSQPPGSPSANIGTPPFAPIFVDTGNILASNFQLFDPEIALILGPLSLQSEYAFAIVDQIGGQNLFFSGYMAQASWFLTGEHRPYDREKGIHKRLKVNDEFFRTRGPGGGIARGLGAWELAARYSTINLNDANIQGNELTDFTFGLNWYLNPFTRLKFNYIRANLDDLSVGKSKTDAFGMRFDFDF
jgi:phosphate-selective porin OprO/OprP